MVKERQKTLKHTESDIKKTKNTETDNKYPDIQRETCKHTLRHAQRQADAQTLKDKHRDSQTHIEAPTRTSKLS